MGEKRVDVRQEGGEIAVIVDKDPDTCPICFHGIEPIDLKINHLSHGTYHGKSLECIFRCPRQLCQRLFIARYSVPHYSSGYVLRETLPCELANVHVSDEIEKISQDFCNIYNEANKAEQLGLLLVAGPGYRKSLEFLIKDYLCILHPNEADKIKEKQLGNCINEYVKDGNVKFAASRAAWLGNDEIHYFRKWEDKDLQDLKKLIALTQHWIESEKLTEDLKTSMATGKP